ncbi:MAG: M61 family metallopeptidase [Gemmatimonadaceae bacterium]|nr:M61 family metallopeptidase [Gemmatimonadaceae bacterium]
MLHLSRPQLALRTLAALLVAGGAPTPLAAQRSAPDSAVSAPVSDLRYEVTVDGAALAMRRLRVTTSFTVSGPAPVVLSLPAWTPGAYEISNFANRVIGFGATQGGAALRWDKLDFDSWRVRPSAAGRVTLSFEFLADTLDNAMAWTRPDFALFNGTNLFLYPEGRSKDFAATVVLRTETGFRVATSMPGAGSAHTYRAANYHDLVDMPVFVGRFDLDSATISGKTVRYATYPVGSVTGSARSQAWDQMKRIIPVEALVFGEVPWDSYSLLQIADSSYGGYSGLEHASSHVDIVSPAFVGSEFQPSLYAHEIFHAWNVKRLRPAEMVPYEYDRPQPTPWLWVSEGITDYYADLAEVRGGVIDATGFYALTSGKMAEIENTTPFALEDASVNTWVHPRDGTEYSYYPKGSLAGLLLDIQIRDASDNRASLDQVMREIYHTTYKGGRGFTYADFWGAVRRAANGRSFEDFARRYVDGREPYPWPEALRTIGLRFERDSVPRLGITTSGNPTGAVQVTDVAPGGAGALAGVRTGDLLVRVGDIEVSDPNFGVKFRAAYAGRAGGVALPIIVRRGAENVTLSGRLVYAPGPPHITEDPDAPARAVRLRNGILRGMVDR